ncbi:MAG: transketolase [Patescibacteria group bacterium]
MPRNTHAAPILLNLDAAQIKKKANEARAYILMAIHFAGSGHPGGSLSVVDTEAALYFNVMRHDPKNPSWEGRDRLFISGQHKCPAQYAVMGLAGYYPVEDFATELRTIGTAFQGHPDWMKLPGIEMSGGSLGQGLGIAIGSALAARLNGEDHRIYCIMGDGEQQEGSIWEAAMSAAHYKLDNLCAVVDCNKLQIDGNVSDVMDIEPVKDKYVSFGWNVIEADGHDIPALLKAFEQAKTVKGKPTVLVIHTIKGKGVSFMENNAGWHGKGPTLEETQAALKELGLAHLLTPKLMQKAKELRDEISHEYGKMIPKERRPHWWNAEEGMRVKMVPTRMGFGGALARIGSDKRVVCLGADISSSICIYDFCKNNPERKDRFLSMGIAEQNMTTVAAGLAKEGKIPVIGSYSVFVTGRNWDQLRTTVCYSDLNVKIAVGHGGISVGPDGATHQGLEDISLLTILPNMKVVVPCDSIEADKATEEIVMKQKGPGAVRLAREATPIVTTPTTPFVFGKANICRFRKEAKSFIEAFEWFVSDEYTPEDEKLCIMACGPEVPEAMRAAYILKVEHEIETRVVNMHTVKPLDIKTIKAAAKEIGNIITVEEHQVGGFGNLVAGVVARAGLPVKMDMIGVKDRFGESGQPWELIWKFGLAAEHIVASAKELLKIKK